MGFGIGGLLKQILLPPGGFLFLSLLGLMLMRRHRRAGFYMTSAGLLLLTIASLPFTANVLLSWLEPETALKEQYLTNPIDTEQNIKSPQAIVILTAGRHYNTPDFAGDTTNAMGLERIRYGVWLARRTQLPILVSGGLGDKTRPPLAELMRQIVEDEFALPVRWIETKSHNTHENAKYSTGKLKTDGIESIYLVTHAAHMKRSVMSFKKFGLTIHPAPTAFSSTGQLINGPRSFLPDANALRRTALVFHEWVGMLWYWVRY
jgi:uncharacterized SAM-binding protein YcdF (DUF218 family)